MKVRVAIATVTLAMMSILSGCSSSSNTLTIGLDNIPFNPGTTYGITDQSQTVIASGTISIACASSSTCNLTVMLPTEGFYTVTFKDPSAGTTVAGPYSYSSLVSAPAGTGAPGGPGEMYMYCESVLTESAVCGQ